MFRSDIFSEIRQQKGVVIVLAALLLPIAMVCAGFAIDMGNLYIHKSRLQNTADAAVLAGARTYAENSESISRHPKADADAQSYVSLNIKPLGSTLQANQQKYQAQTVNGTTYYRVKLKENVPLYFLHFLKAAQPVEVDAVASIVSSGGSTFENLFIFKKKISVVNSIENPDNFNISGQIKTTFDGKIGYTEKNPTLTYSTQCNPGTFFTKQAQTTNSSVNTAKSNGYTNNPYAMSYDYTAFSKSLEANSQHLVQNDQNARTSSFSASSKQVIWFTYAKTPNVSISVDANLPGSSASATKNTPVFVYIEKDIGIVNINMNQDTGRPLVICYLGGSLHFNLNGHTFRGVIYAPNCDDLLININNGIFSGTIVSSSLDLQGGAGTYRYEDFGDLGGSGSASGSAKVSLSNEQLNWGD